MEKTAKVKIRIPRKKLILNKYNHLLIVLILSFIFLPLTVHKEGPMGFSLVWLTLLCALLMALRAVLTSRKILVLCIIFVVSAYGMDVIRQHISHDQNRVKLGLLIAGQSIYIFFFLIAIIAMLKQLFHLHKVTVDNIVGGICIYLLIGLAWTCVYLLIGSLDPTTFKDVDAISLFYFSFTTLTTLGYGDIVPRGELAMVATNLEAIAGQLYVAVFIARLVGLYIASEATRTGKT